MLEEMILDKVVSLVNYLISKPNEAMTYDDYMILASEFRDIRARKTAEEENRKPVAVNRRVR